jgi:tRNA (guanine-N7-)-methyltransferase
MSEEKPMNEGSAWVPAIRLSGADRRWQKAADGDLEGAMLPEPTSGSDETLDFAAIFGNDHPVELEIGCGKGAFLVTAAELYPTVNFVGVEVAPPFARAAADRMLRRGLVNVRVMCSDAGRLVREHVRSESLSAIHLYFPDPWPKKRHQKRRIFSPEFLDAVHRALRPGGRLCLATDFHPYYEVMRQTTDIDPRFVRLSEFEWYASGGVTNFEKKYLRAGRTSYRAAFRTVDPEVDAARI